MTRRPDFLYTLLPAIYRQRDLDRESALRALFSVLQDQYDLLESDIAALYDDWFVETCEPWVLPYIGELVAAGRLARRAHPAIGTRCLVANTLAYRRRKGTPAVLEQAVAAATGWPARVVEPRRLLAMTQAMACPLPNTGRTVDIRDAHAVARLGGPFDDTARLVAIRPGGLHHLGRLAIYLWRLQSYPVLQAEAADIAHHPGGRTFHPLGLDLPLCNRPAGRQRAGHPTDERHLPVPLRRAVLALDVAAVKAAGSQGPGPDSFLGDPAAFAIFLRDADDPRSVTPIPPADWVIADLTAWQRPPSGDARVAIDPECGRLMLLRSADHHAVVVTDYCHGFADDIGGGGYARAAAPDRLPAATASPWTYSPDGTIPFDLQTQVSAWQGQPADGSLDLPDSRTYALSQPLDLRGAGGRTLIMRAAAGERPCLKGGLHVIGGTDDGTLILEGLLIGGTVRIEGNLSVILRHCTVAAAKGMPAIAFASHAGGPARMRVVIDSCIVGAVRLPAEGVRLEIWKSIIDGGQSAAISGERGPGPPSVIRSATLNGAVSVRQITASDTLFLAPLDITERHEGYIRHSYVPPSSRVPDCFHCLPQHDAEGAAGIPLPRFVSRRLGQPGYFYFSPDTPPEILTGASDGMAMGAYHDLGDAIRRDNYKDALTEYLPYGVEVSTRYAS